MAIVYTDNAGTEANSQAFASRIEATASAAGLVPSSIVDQRDFANLPPTSYDAPLFFYRSSLSHDGTVSYWFGRLLAHAQLK